jgi:hypothetical protein
LSTYLRAAKRKRAAEVLPFDDEGGKAPLTVKAFTYFAKQAHLTATDPAIDCYQIFCWNLIARSISIAAMEWMHLSWSDDHLIVNSVTSKTDKEGNASNYT